MEDLHNFSDTAPEGAELNLAQYAERAYLDYAVSVVKGRALPDVCDGQKPVQRRILYAMDVMGLHATAKPVKAARVVGDVLGKFHPHGDQAAYDALVRMAQNFSLRYPLIDGHGNFGSRDGDGAAAMRYTEARLTAIAHLLLAEIDEGTVDFQANYDGSMREPKCLPARLPMVLLNGASGIAVGMATEIPAHNLREVASSAIALLRDPKLTDDALFSLLPGPDFPGGGQIISALSELRDIYSSGRGSIKVRARWTFEELARGQWKLVVSELPHGVSGQKVLEEIEELTNPKVRVGKKALSPEQQALKTSFLAMLDTVRDESGKDAAVRLVFEPKTARINRDEFVRNLLAHTSMESNVSINLVMIGIDGRPQQKNLRTILTEWLSFRSHTVTRRTEFRLNKVNDRIHILEGRMVVFLNVDEVIRTIRESDEPKPALIQRFSLTEVQAEDILEMRLRQLARLEGIRIEQELKDLQHKKSDLEELLANPNSMRRQIIKEIEADAKQYGDARRTLIEPAQRAVIETPVIDEPVTVIVSHKGWLRARQGHGHDAELFTFKAGDGLYGAFECRTTDHLVAISSSGRSYAVSVAQLPSARGDGTPITSMIDLEPGASIQHMIAAPAQQAWLLSTQQGYGFVAKLGDMATRQRAGKQFVSLESGDALLRPVPVYDGASKVAVLSDQLRLLVFALDEMKTLSGGGRGNLLIDLAPKESLAQVVVFGLKGLQVHGQYRNKVLIEELSAKDLAAYTAKRARKGKTLALKGKSPVLVPIFNK